MEDEKILAQDTGEEENNLPQEEPEIKPALQIVKEGWYDKIPLTLKQLDIIVYTCWGLLGLTFLLIALEAMDIVHLFG